VAKNSHLKELQALGPLEVLRADLGEEGSFDEAVAGCDYAFLVAAPMNVRTKDPQKELVEAAVQARAQGGCSPCGCTGPPKFWGPKISSSPLSSITTYLLSTVPNVQMIKVNH